MNDSDDSALPSVETEHVSVALLNDVDTKGLSVGRLRLQCNALVASDAVDKTAALQIMRLHHAMETLYLNEQHALTRKVDSLNNEIAVLNLGHQNADAVDALASENKKIKITVTDLESKLEQINESLTRLEETCADNVVRIQTIAAQKRR